jgi:thioredoxin 1
MKALNITKHNFEDEVMNSSKPVLLDFWAKWCLPCLMASPIIEEIAGEEEGVKVGKVNVDEEPELVEAFNIMAMPTFIVLKDGEVISTVTGIKPKAVLLNMLEA